MALGVVPAWSGRYILDFERVIAEVQDSATSGEGGTPEEDARDEPHFSFITGRLVTSKHYGDMIEEDTVKENVEGVLVTRNADTTVGRLIGSAAGEPLLDATFKIRLIFLIRRIPSNPFMARSRTANRQGRGERLRARQRRNCEGLSKSRSLTMQRRYCQR